MTQAYAAVSSGVNAALKAFLILVQDLSASVIHLSLSLVSQALAKAFPHPLDILLRKITILATSGYLSLCRVK